MRGNSSSRRKTRLSLSSPWVRPEATHAEKHYGITYLELRRTVRQARSLDTLNAAQSLLKAMEKYDGKR